MSYSIHHCFRLNGKSFSSVDDLLLYAEKLEDKHIHIFLKDWFSLNDNFEVKTSGSTGVPKTIVIQKKHAINSALATGIYFQVKQNSMVLLCLPVAYIAGKMMLIRALILGWHLDVVAPNTNPLENIEKQYDFSAMVPLQLENSISNIHKIQKLIVGGGVVSNQLSEKLQSITTEVFATYGMTETITHIAIKKLNNPILVKGKVLTKSHFSQMNSFYTILPNITVFKDQRNCLVIKAPKISDEIIFTNDVVQLISNQQFDWLGRYDNVINSGGIKLQPEHIEKKLNPIIAERFFTIGIPDDKLGEKLVLCIEGSEKEMSFEGLALTKYEIPKEIYFIDRFKETDSGKIQRKETLQKILPKLA